MQLSEWLERQRVWSEKTFGPGRRTLGLVEHIRKELKEIEADPTDPMEWVDVMILALDGAWRTGATIGEITTAIPYHRLLYCSELTSLYLGYLEAQKPYYGEGPPYFIFWIAIFLCSLNELTNMGYCDDAILTMLTAKQEVNMQSQWPPWQPEDTAVEHVRGDA